MASGGTQIDAVSRGFIQGDTTITGPGLRVKLSGSTAYTVVLAGATDEDIGTAGSVSSGNGFGTAGDRVTVFLNTKMGTQKMVAGAAITANAPVYPAASGKVTGVPNGRPIGLALEAASGDGSFIEVQRVNLPTQGYPVSVVTVKTASATLTAADIGTTLVANHASVEVDFTLPAPTAANVGAIIDFKNIGAATMGILPASVGDIMANGTAAASVNSVKFSTSSHILGASARAVQVTSALWVVTNTSDCTMTIA